MRALLIDDHIEEMSNVRESLRTSGIETVPLTGISELDRFLKSQEPFDLVILDWFLDGSDPGHAKGCLGLLKEHRFVPVIIYTEHKQDYERDAQDVAFPASCRIPISKADVPGTDLGAVVREWVERFIPGRISRSWRDATRSSVEKVLYDLASMDEGGVQAALTFMIRTKTDETIDTDHAVEILQRMCGRHVMQDSGLREALDTGLQPGRAPAQGSQGRIWQYHMYCHPGDDMVRAGDIVRLTWPGTGREDIFVVLTPACDLAEFKTTILRLLGMSEAPTFAGTLPAQEYPLLHLPLGGGIGNYRVHFYETLPLRNATILEELEKLQRGASQKKPPRIHMSYRHSYADLVGTKVELARLCRLDDPYRSDMFQKFSSHASRIGTPDMPTEQAP